MLKINRIEDAEGTLLHLQGKLLGPWVDELRRAAGAGGRLRLDLSCLTFADSAGEDLLRALLAGGAELVSCSGFVAALLQTKEGR